MNDRIEKLNEPTLLDCIAVARGNRSWTPQEAEQIDQSHRLQRRLHDARIIVESIRDPARTERLNVVVEQLRRFAVRWMHCSVNNAQLYERLRNQDPEFDTKRGEEDAFLKEFERWRMPVLGAIDDLFTSNSSFRGVASELSMTDDDDALAKELGLSYGESKHLFSVVGPLLLGENRPAESLYLASHCLVSSKEVQEDVIAQVMLDALMKLNDWRTATTIGDYWPEFARQFLDHISKLQRRTSLPAHPAPLAPRLEVECIASFRTAGGPELPPEVLTEVFKKMAELGHIRFPTQDEGPSDARREP